MTANIFFYMYSILHAINYSTQSTQSFIYYSVRHVYNCKIGQISSEDYKTVSQTYTQYEGFLFFFFWLHKIDSYLYYTSKYRKMYLSLTSPHAGAGTKSTPGTQLLHFHKSEHSDNEWFKHKPSFSFPKKYTKMINNLHRHHSHSQTSDAFLEASLKWLKSWREKASRKVWKLLLTHDARVMIPNQLLKILLDIFPYQ